MTNNGRYSVIDDQGRLVASLDDELEAKARAGAYGERWIERVIVLDTLTCESWTYEPVG